jgi:hypothetical protein
VKRPKAPELHAVLTTEEVAAWLRVSTRTVERRYPAFIRGRYLVAHVLEALTQQRKVAA